MTLCMTLSGHTSTLPRLVVWGAGFQGHFLDLTKTQFCATTGTHLDRGRDLVIFGMGYHYKRNRKHELEAAYQKVTTLLL